MNRKRNRKNIMLIDDDHLLREVVGEILVEEGYDVLSFPDGVKALKVYKEKADSIELVLLDMVMPGLNGIEVVIEMKKTNPKVKVIIMSGYTDEEILKYMNGGNIIEFVHKPISLLELTFLVQKAIKEV